MCDCLEALRINYVMPAMLRTGGTRVLLNFAKELSKRGHEISIITGLRSNWFALPSDVTINTLGISGYSHFGRSFIYSRFNKKYRFIADVKFLYKLYNKIPPSDINIATFSTTAYPVYWKSKESSTPFFHMQHMETLFPSDPMNRQIIKGTYSLPIYKIANSTWLKQRVKDLTGEDVNVVNGAVEHELFNVDECIKEEKDDNTIDIVTLGKGGWKRMDDVISAFKEIKKDKTIRRKLRFHIFGNTKVGNSKLSKSLTKSDGIVVHGKMSDLELAKLYNICDIQVTYSTAESFPLPPLEAMACGAAVITTPYGTEDYASHLHNALVVNPYNRNELQNALVTLINDDSLRHKLIENGLKTANDFSYTKQTEILEIELRRAMDLDIERKRDITSRFSHFGIPI